MVFENRLAKIGKGKNVNLYIKNDDEINIILFINSCVEKTLNVSKETYTLLTKEKSFPYQEVIRLNDKLFIVYQNYNIGIMKIND